MLCLQLFLLAICILQVENNMLMRGGNEVAKQQTLLEPDVELSESSPMAEDFIKMMTIMEEVKLDLEETKSELFQMKEELAFMKSDLKVQRKHTFLCILS